MRALLIGVAALALSAGAASAQVPGYDYNGDTVPLYGYAAPGYGYAATAPLYDYAAPGYGYAAPVVAPGQAGTTIVIVTPSPAYTAPTGISRPLYSYAPGYWGGYGGYGRWRTGYWWR
jgi:hypothetical protein